MRIPIRHSLLWPAALCLLLPTSAPAIAQGSRSVPAGPAAAMPASWWNRTTMRSGAESPSRFYAVRSDLPDADTREFARHLDLMHVEYQKRLAGLEQRAPGDPAVYMFQRRQDYLDTMRSRFGVDASGSGGMFFVTPRGSGLAFCVEGVPRSQLLGLIQHEGFHHVAFTRFGTDLPPWVDEGLAEYFAAALVFGSEVIVGHSSARSVQALRQAIEAGTTIPVLEMVTMTPQAWARRVTAGDATLQYQQAWSMVHFLIHGEDGRYRSAFEQYLRLINNGLTSVEAFRRAFGTTDLTDFERRWKAAAAVATASGMATAAERLTFLAEGMLALRAEDQRPADFAEFRDLLQRRRFSITLDHHGHKIRLSAEDPGMFEVPSEEQAKSQPAFELVPHRLRGSTLRERRQEEADPTPAAIATSGLRPRDLQVRWRRTDARNGFTYEIVPR